MAKGTKISQAEKTATKNRDAELARRTSMHAGQASAARHSQPPLVTAGS